MRSKVASGIVLSVFAVTAVFATAVFAQQSEAPVAAPVPANSTQPQSAKQPVTTLSITTREVLLDVLVTDANGQPVTGLRQSDFQIQEENTPQVIRSLQERTSMSAADVAKLNSNTKLPPNTFTNYVPIVNTNASTVILLDALNTPVQAQMYLREQLIAYLKNMQPGASIAIFQLDSDMHLIQGFSSDPQVLLEAAKSKRNMPSLLGPTEFRNPGSREEYRRVKRQILRDGMQMMGKYLAGFPGRKNLIWFTGEVPLTIFGNGLGNPFKDNFNVVGDAADDLTDIADVLTVSRVAVYPIDSRGLQTAPQFDVARGGRPGSGSSMGFVARQDFDHSHLDTVADATGGRAYYNSNGLKNIIAEIVNSGSNYYTLAYSTTNRDWNGQYRHIKVTVDRPGVRLQYRRGYYAVNRDQQEARQLAALQRRRAKGQAAPPPPEASPEPAPGGSAEDSGVERPDDQGALMHHPSKGGFDESMALGAVPPTEIIFHASVAPDNQTAKLDKKAPLPPDNFLRPEFLGKPVRTYNLLLVADLHRIKLSRTSDGIRHGTVDFVSVVYGSSGEVVNSLLSTLSLDLNDGTYRKALLSGLPVKQQIAIPVKGNYFLRVGVHDIAGDQVGALEIPVDQIKLGVAGAGLQTP